MISVLDEQPYQIVPLSSGTVYAVHRYRFCGSVPTKCSTHLHRILLRMEAKLLNSSAATQSSRCFNVFMVRWHRADLRRPMPRKLQSPRQPQLSRAENHTILETCSRLNRSLVYTLPATPKRSSLQRTATITPQRTLNASRSCVTLEPKKSDAFSVGSIVELPSPRC